MPRALLILVTALFAQHAAADAIKNTFPVASIAPDTVGILYPGFSVAAGVNGAALPKAGRGTAFQLGYSPAIQGWQSHGAFGSVAHAKGSFGIGAGYQGSLAQDGTLTNGAFAGMGYNVDNFSFGFFLHEDNFAFGISPEINAGLTVELPIVDFGIVFHGLNQSPSAILALGTRSGSRMNVELNVETPSFYNLGGRYIITLSAQLDAGILGFYFRTSYYTDWNGLYHTVGLGGWAWDAVNLSAQYNTNGQGTMAATFVF
ncbi:hypothetical protein K2X33_09435 [bacterium]|nr:hypothetical protein [bacterium]